MSPQHVDIVTTTYIHHPTLLHITISNQACLSTDVRSIGVRSLLASTSGLGNILARQRSMGCTTVNYSVLPVQARRGIKKKLSLLVRGITRTDRYRSTLEAGATGRVICVIASPMPASHTGKNGI